MHAGLDVSSSLSGRVGVVCGPICIQACPEVNVERHSSSLGIGKIIMLISNLCRIKGLSVSRLILFNFQSGIYYMLGYSFKLDVLEATFLRKK